MPSDRRAAHQGEAVAGTSWTGCSPDAFRPKDAAALIRDQIVAELNESKLFARVSRRGPSAGDLVLRTEIDAFCSQTSGFLSVRTAGITALKVTVERDGKKLLEQKFESVVTDADPQYTGSQAGFVERTQQQTIADSLREVLKDMLQTFDRDAARWTGSSSEGRPGPSE